MNKKKRIEDLETVVKCYREKLSELACRLDMFIDHQGFVEVTTPEKKEFITKREYKKKWEEVVGVPTGNR